MRPADCARNKLAQIFIKSTVVDLASIEKQVAKTKSLYGRFMHACAGPMNDAYTQSTELHLKAEACHRAALRAEDAATRATLLRLMAAWREIARQVKRVEEADRSLGMRVERQRH